MSDIRKRFAEVKTKAIGVCDCPELGVVHIRALTLADMEKMKGAGDVESIIYSVLLGVSDELGNRVFGQEDWDTVKNLPWNIVNAIAQAVSKFNKLSEETVAEEKKD